jgi:hypothetical protein
MRPASMARRPHTFPFALVEGEPGELKDWSRIQSAFGVVFPERVRRGVSDATWLYRFLAPCELAALPVSDVDKLISSVRRQAKQLQTTLLKASQLHHGAAAAMVESFSDNIVTAEGAITTPQDAKLNALAQPEDASAYIAERQAKEADLPPLKINAVATVMSSLVRRCELAEAELKNSKLPGHVVGEAWDRWVCDLTKIIEDAGLPIEAGRHVGDGAASFALFVEALQSELPLEHRRYTQSREALVQGIHRARRNRRKSEVGGR